LLGGRISKVHVTALLEVSELDTCRPSQPPSALTLSMALAAEYAVGIANSNQSEFRIAEIDYGKFHIKSFRIYSFTHVEKKFKIFF